MDVVVVNPVAVFVYAVFLCVVTAYVVVVLVLKVTGQLLFINHQSLNTIYSTPIFSQVMKRDRFELIVKFLLFNDNSTYDSTDADRDRLHKVRPLMIDGLRERWRKFKNLSVDESLVLFKGRLHFKKFIQTKRVCFGIKLFELCTSPGITLDLLVYCGKGMFSDDDLGEDMLNKAVPCLPCLWSTYWLTKGN